MRDFEFDLIPVKEQRNTSTAWSWYKSKAQISTFGFWEMYHARDDAKIEENTMTSALFLQLPINFKQFQNDLREQIVKQYGEYK